MRCLYVGVFKPHCSDIFRVKGMYQAGFEIRALDFRKIYSERKLDGLVNDIVHCCYSFSPDFILINKGEKFTPDVLKAIKESAQIPIFLFFGDKREHWPQFIIDTLPYYDAFLINSDDDSEKEGLKKYNPKRIVYHHSATDLRVFQKNYSTEENVDVIFFGSNYNELFPGSAIRRDWIMRLRNETDISLRIYGGGWNVTARSAVYGESYAHEASQAKMLLGFNAFNDIRLYTSNRAFNSMACGTFLSTKWNGCETMFKDGVEIEYFSTYVEMVTKIRLLKDDALKRRRIYEAGRQRLEKDHTYKVRAQELEKLFYEIR